MELKQLKRITDGGLGAGSPAAGGYGNFFFFFFVIFEKIIILMPFRLRFARF